MNKRESFCFKFIFYRKSKDWFKFVEVARICCRFRSYCSHQLISALESKYGVDLMRNIFGWWIVLWYSRENCLIRSSWEFSFCDWWIYFLFYRSLPLLLYKMLDSFDTVHKITSIAKNRILQFLLEFSRPASLVTST